MILITDIIIFGATMYVSAIFYLKHLNLYIWDIPYDDEKTMKKLEPMRDSLQQFIFGTPIFVLIVVAVFVFIMMTD